MKKMKKLIALTAAIAIFGSQVHAQECCPAPAPICGDDCAAYCDSGRASYLSAALPVGALVVAAIIIATTNRHHHHHNSGNCCDRSCSSSSHSH